MSPRLKGMETADAREKKLQGHRAEAEFAALIGGKVYARGGGRKKDVYDKNGDHYSVKAGAKKWQIFLYSRKRCMEDEIIQALNGMGDALVRCLDAFPETHAEYEGDKPRFKEALKAPMRRLRDILSRRVKLTAFLKEALFTDGIDYLAVKDGEAFHVFPAKGVLREMSAMRAENSEKRGKNQTDCQKVVFKRDDKTVGEIEIRTDPTNYRAVKFWMDRRIVLKWMLDANIPGARKVGPQTPNLPLQK